ncbi:TonB-dependent receptor [Horticoccus sp. 23ND18S-11]|uniref:TonB-dependent receptor n=1 Tax=Horticoccus sp. 23ND18S-11 TaxID=3391832 RepID=UPI0039C8D05A
MKPPLTTSHHIALAALALTGALTASAAPAPVTDKGVARLEQVVVQERKGSVLTDLQRTAISGTAIGDEQIRLSGLDSLQDLSHYTPNLSLSTSGGRSFGDNLAIRGLANSAFFSDSSVVVYVDDAPFGDVFSFVPELYEVESIEILRGAQGTLFGKNSEAGVINITTRKPTNATSGEVSHSYAKFGEETTRAGVMGPLIKGQLYYGLSGAYSVRDGLLSNSFLGNAPDQRQGWNGRFFTRWTPSEAWTISFEATASASSDGAPRTQSLSAREYSVDSNVPGRLETDNNSQSVRIVHTTPTFTVTSITTRRDWTLDPLNFDLDLTRFPAPGSGNFALIKQDQEQWSEELRLQSPFGSKPWKWLGGLYLSSTKAHGDNTRNFYVPFPGFFETQRTVHTQKADNVAAFGNATYAVSDKLGVTVGLRLDHTHKSLERTKSALFSPPTLPLSKGQDFFNLGTNLTVDYRISDTLLVYGLTGSGFKAGGYSAFIDPPTSAKFDSEHVWTNEVGVKATSADKKLTVNAAVFYYYIWDYQVERSLPFSTDYAVFNAPAARSLGAEIEVHARPLDGLDLSASLGTTQLEFRRFRAGAAGPDFKGNTPPFVPAFNASVAAQYKHATGFFGRVEVIAVGETHFDEENSALYREPSYTSLNARIGYESARGGLHFFGRNLKDDFHYEKRVAGLAAGVPAAPFTVGVMGTLRF